MCGAFDVIAHALVRVLLILAHFSQTLVVAIVAFPGAVTTCADVLAFKGRQWLKLFAGLALLHHVCIIARVIVGRFVLYGFSRWRQNFRGKPAIFHGGFVTAYQAMF